MSVPKRRTYLGRTWASGSRQKVYAIEDGLEVDDIYGYEITRRRVFYEDVLLITYHVFRGVGFLVIVGALAFLFGWFTIAVAMEQPAAAVFFGSFTFAPFAIMFLLRVVLGVDVITVFGRRTKAELRFSFKKRRARLVFRMLVERTRAAQEALARKIEAESEPGPSESVPDEFAPPDIEVAGSAGEPESADEEPFGDVPPA